MGRGGNHQLLISVKQQDLTVKQTDKLVNKYNRGRKALFVQPAWGFESVEYDYDYSRHCSETGCEGICRCSTVDVSFTGFNPGQFKDELVKTLSEQLKKQRKQVSNFKRSKAGKQSGAQTENQFLVAFAEYTDNKTKNSNKKGKFNFSAEKVIKIYNPSLQKRLFNLENSQQDQAVLEQLILDFGFSEDCFEAKIVKGYYGEEFEGSEFDQKSLNELSKVFGDYLLHSQEYQRDLDWYSKHYLLANTDYSAQEVEAYLKTADRKTDALVNPLINQMSSEMHEIEEEIKEDACPNLKAIL